MNFKLSLLKSIIKEEVKRILNEDSLLVKKISKDLYTFLKSNGVTTQLIQTANKQWKAIGSKEAEKLNPNTGLIVIKYPPKYGGVAVIDVTLVGEKSGVEGVEKKLLSAYPGLEQKDRILRPHTIGGLTNSRESGYFILNFIVMEKTTKKGGFVSNTQTNKPAGSSANIF